MDSLTEQKWLLEPFAERRRDGGREQRGCAMAGVEGGHPPHRVRARHAVGAGAAVDVEVDEARQHVAILGHVARRLDFPNGGGAAQPSGHEALGRQDLPGDDRRLAHGAAIIASGAAIAYAWARGRWR